MFCSEFAYVLWLSVSMRKVAGKHPFCVLIYMNCYIFHIYFILFILLSYLITRKDEKKREERRRKMRAKGGRKKKERKKKKQGGGWVLEERGY